ncbi:hypothetical protein ONZ45_g14280 [Pleurotus djamor]|nr:hypothetical protein ONZ45_g14280 [Pleurotus djamor]
MQTRTISGSTDLDVSPTTSNTPTHPHLPTLQIRESWNYESPTRDTLYVTHISITQHFSATHDGVNNAVPRHFDILDIFTVFFVSPWKLIRTRCNRVSLRAARTDFCGFNSPKHEYTMNRKTRHKCEYIPQFLRHRGALDRVYERVVRVFMILDVPDLLCAQIRVLGKYFVV